MSERSGAVVTRQSLAPAGSAGTAASDVGRSASPGLVADGQDSSGDDAATFSAATTLAQVLESLGMGVLDIVAAPVGLAVGVGETVVHGAGEPVPDRPRGILLATGARTTQEEIAGDLRAAAAAGYSAVVVKRYGADTAPWAAAAAAAGIALLTTPDEMSWRHLDSLLAATVPIGVAPADRYASVGSGDLFSLANAIAAAVGGAITIEDPDGRVLAYSNLPHQEIDEIRRSAILGRQTPERPTNREEYQAVFARRGPVPFVSEGPGHAGRTAIGLWAGRRPLGIIWVINDRPPLVANARQVLIDAARVAELQLLRMRGARDPDRGRRTQVLRGVLDGRIDSGTVRSDLGLDSAGACRVLAIGPRTAEAGEEPADGQIATVSARIVDVVTLFCEGWDPRSLCVAIDDTVYAIVPARGPTGARRATATSADTEAHQQDRLRRMGQEMVTAARRSADLDLVVAIGPIIDGPAAIPTGRTMVDRVLEVQRARLRDPGEQAPRPVATMEDLLPAVILTSIADRLTPAEFPTMPAVAALLESDATTGTPYAQTVLAFLSTMGDYARTAHLLTVHENTVRYRMKRVHELYGLDLGDTDAILVAWLQLRLLSG